jgi:hypothetical protein
MGSSVILDIIGSFVVFGVLLLTGLRMDTNAVEERFAYNTAVNLQLQLVSLSAQIEDDFRKIGYDPTELTLDPSTTAIRYGDSTDFKFAGDINNDGKIDSVEYLLGPSQGLRNPNIRVLVRKYWDGASTANNRIDSIRANVVQFKMTYYLADRNTQVGPPVGAAVGSASGVGMICLSLSLESPDKYTGSTVYQETDTSLYKVYWRQFQIVAKNMTYR